MQDGARLRAQQHRGMAAEFRLLAEVEPVASLRRHLQKLAAQRDDAATDLETPQPNEHRDPGTALG
jgi:hypothetical protein